MSSNFSVDDDLDAEFLKLQQEVAQLPAPPSPPPPPPSPLPSAPVPAPSSETILKERRPDLLAAPQVLARAEPSQPSWQLGLQERDRLEQREAAKTRREADTITGVAEAQEQAHVSGGTANGSTPLPNGEWVSSNGRWEWRTFGGSQSGAASSTVATGTSIGVIAGTSSSGARARSNKRTAAGEVWVDSSLSEWPHNDFRIHVSDLAPDATDAELSEAFQRYGSFNMARVVSDKRSGKCRGYGFVSFGAGEDMVAALREMNGKYVGSRPVKLKKSNWQKRNLTGTRRKELKLFRTIGKNKR